MDNDELRKRELNDILAVMSTKEGRRFIWRQLENAGVFRTSFTGEVNSTMFKEGQRNQGLMLYGDVMESCPELFLTMSKEANDDSTEATARGE